MFHKEFYPTPINVIEQIGIDCYGKTVLEPSAGKGDIVDYLNSFGAKDVVACEINSDLRKILSGKCRIISEDFFSVTSDQISHVQMIVMNPPFSNADKHILHAWEIAPEGCEIIALCNWETLNNRYSSSRTALGKIIEDYGEKSNLGNVFSEAERTTDVAIGLIRVFKPITSQEFDYDGFFYEQDVDSNDNGVISYNDIRAVVNSYVAAVRCFSSFEKINKEMNGYTSLTGFGDGFKFSVGYRDEGIVDRESFSKKLQHHCWKHIFNKIGIEKYVTKGVMEDINKFIESRKNYPFTMRNVYRMIEIIVGTRKQIMDKAIVQAVDNFTRHTHENRYGVKGWKTNSGHLLGKKFIIGRISETSFSGKCIGIIYYNCYGYDYLIDLMKALCFLTGKDFDKIKKGHEHRELSPNTWYDWGFFEFKVFLKGTGHFKFKDEKVWELLNRTYARIKGEALPEKI